MIDLVPVLAIIFIVPAITMRLLSEEQRSGTIEVLLTAPVDESTIVLSKFFAGFVMYLVVCMFFFYGFIIFFSFFLACFFFFQAEDGIRDVMA